MKSGFKIAVALNPHEGAHNSLMRCRAAREELRRWCRAYGAKLAVSSEWQHGMPVVVFHAAV